jgi:hypothetical protein
MRPFTVLILFLKRVHNIAKSEYLFSWRVCLSIRMEQLGAQWTNLNEIWCSSIFFENLWRKFKFHENLTRITGTSHYDQCPFMIISHSVLLRMRNVSDKGCRENQNTHFMFHKLLPKIVSFMRWCAKIWYSHPGHRWQYNNVLDNRGYRLTFRKKLACSIYDSTNSSRDNATRHMHPYHRYMCRSAVPYGTYRSVA